MLFKTLRYSPTKATSVFPDSAVWSDDRSFRRPLFFAHLLHIRDKPLEKESEKADMRSAESKYPDGTGPLFYQYMTAGAGHERKYDSKENRKYEDKMQ